MYYSYINNFRGKTYQFIVISFLFAIFFLNIFGTNVFAKLAFTETAEEYRSLGFQAQQEGDFDRALTFYQKLLTIEENSWVHNNIGVVYENLGMKDKAELHYLRALELDADYLPPYSNLAFLYKERGDIPRAISYFRTRIEFAPENDEWVPLLMEELQQLDPSYRKEVVDVQLQETGQRLFEIKQEELALTVSRANWHYNHAEELAAQNNFDEAVKEIEKAMHLTPDNPKLEKRKKEIRYDQKMFKVREKARRAQEFLDSGDVNSARKEFQTILTILPSESVQE